MSLGVHTLSRRDHLRLSVAGVSEDVPKASVNLVWSRRSYEIWF